MSKHFDRMWESVMQAIKIAMAECDSEFVNRCHPVPRDNDNFAKVVENAYRRIRSELRLECYGTKNDEEYMDARKIASVMCCALMEQQAVHFDADVAAAMMAERDDFLKMQGARENRIEFNRWIVSNFFINYKIAYLTGLFIVLDALTSELLKNQNTVSFGKKLAKQGQPFQYPPAPNVDSFNVSMVLGLGRAGMQRRPPNTFLLALQYYQIEMYTRLALGLDERCDRTDAEKQK